MSDPGAANETAIREHFVHQAAACEAMGSPFTGRLCRMLSKILDRNTMTGQRVLDWPGRAREDALALRLCGGLHALVLSRTDCALADVYPPNEAHDESIADVLSATIVRHDE